MSLVILGLGDFAFWRRLLTILLTESACSVSSGLIADSTLATISVAGIFVGVIALTKKIKTNKNKMNKLQLLL